MSRNFSHKDEVDLGEIGYPGYLINGDGVLFKNVKGTWLPVKIRYNNFGTVIVNIVREDGKRTTVPLANLVARAFLHRRNEDDNTLIHLNGVKDDCRASNLAWRPRWFANAYHRMFDKHDVDDEENYVQEIETGIVFENIMLACVRYGILFDDVLTSIETTLPTYPGEPRSTYPTGTTWRFV